MGNGGSALCFCRWVVWRFGLLLVRRQPRRFRSKKSPAKPDPGHRASGRVRRKGTERLDGKRQRAAGHFVGRA